MLTVKLTDLQVQEIEETLKHFKIEARVVELPAPTG